jgi:hypothetical protein
LVKIIENDESSDWTKKMARKPMIPSQSAPVFKNNLSIPQPNSGNSISGGMHSRLGGGNQGALSGEGEMFISPNGVMKSPLGKR